MSSSISAATEEQTANAKQVSKAVENVNELTQSAASAAEEMSAATEQLSGMAEKLQGMAAQFKTREGGPVQSQIVSLPTLVSTLRVLRRLAACPAGCQGRL